MKIYTLGIAMLLLATSAYGQDQRRILDGEQVAATAVDASLIQGVWNSLRIAEDEQTRIQILAKVLKNYRFSGIQVEVLVSAIHSAQKRQELIEISLLNHPEMTDRERLVARMRRAQPTGQVPDRTTAREASVAL